MSTEWTDYLIWQLCYLWHDKSNKTRVIGLKLGVSKSGIIGKARRLDLPPRPSPIRREPGQVLVAVPRIRSQSNTENKKPPQAAKKPAKTPTPKKEATPPPGQPLRIVPDVPKPVRPYGRVIECCWPIGEPGKRSFRYCSDPSEPGKPYCSDHSKLAHTKIRDRREDAA